MDRLHLLPPLPPRHLHHHAVGLQSTRYLPQGTSTHGQHRCRGTRLQDASREHAPYCLPLPPRYGMERAAARPLRTRQERGRPHTDGVPGQVGCHQVGRGGTRHFLCQQRLRLRGDARHLHGCCHHHGGFGRKDSLLPPGFRGRLRIYQREGRVYLPTEGAVRTAGFPADGRHILALPPEIRMVIRRDTTD